MKVDESPKKKSRCTVCSPSRWVILICVIVAVAIGCVVMKYVDFTGGSKASPDEVMIIGTTTDGKFNDP